MTDADQRKEQITVRVPDKIPALNRQISRILLAILVEAAEREVREGPRERRSNDC
jgi:hypothetical protein